MDNIYIICIDDQREVLNALENDLSEFDELIEIETCESGEEALELINEIEVEGDHIAILVSDQVMPNMSGVELLKKIESDGIFKHTQKILLTGLATHQDTIDAINSAALNHYIQKPWNSNNLNKIIKQSLTRFLLKAGIDYTPYLSVLDQETLYQLIRKNT
ncbi:MAG: response regulator [Bacteroidia bacterium]